MASTVAAPTAATSRRRAPVRERGARSGHSALRVRLKATPRRPPPAETSTRKGSCSSHCALVRGKVPARRERMPDAELRRRRGGAGSGKLRRHRLLTFPKTRAAPSHAWTLPAAPGVQLRKGEGRHGGADEAAPDGFPRPEAARLLEAEEHAADGRAEGRGQACRGSRRHHLPVVCVAEEEGLVREPCLLLSVGGAVSPLSAGPPPPHRPAPQACMRWRQGAQLYPDGRRGQQGHTESL